MACGDLNDRKVSRGIFGEAGRRNHARLGPGRGFRSKEKRGLRALVGLTCHVAPASEETSW